MKTIKVVDINQINKDKELASIMQGQDKAKADVAFSKIYQVYKDRISFNVVKCFFNDADLAKDMTQEIFMKVHEKIDQYDFSTVLSTWMYNIAKNHCIDYQRKNKLDITRIDSLYQDDEGAEMTFQLHDKANNIMSNMMVRERRKIILSSIRKMKKKKLRMVVGYLFIKQLSYEDIAIIMNLPLGTLKTYMFRAKKEILKELTSTSLFADYQMTEEQKVNRSATIIRQRKRMAEWRNGTLFVENIS